MSSIVFTVFMNKLAILFSMVLVTYNLAYLLRLIYIGNGENIPGSELHKKKLVEIRLGLREGERNYLLLCNFIFIGLLSICIFPGLMVIDPIYSSGLIFNAMVNINWRWGEFKLCYYIVTKNPFRSRLE